MAIMERKNKPPKSRGQSGSPNSQHPITPSNNCLSQALSPGPIVSRTDMEMEDTQAGYYLAIIESQSETAPLGLMDFSNINTPSRLTDCSGFELLEAHIEGAERIDQDLDFDFQLFSTPSQISKGGSWIHGADFRVDTGEPPIVEDTLCLDMTSELEVPSQSDILLENMMFEESKEIYTYTDTSTGPTSSSTSPSSISFNGPWSPVEPYSVPNFVPGDVAFAPSPPISSPLPEEHPIQPTPRKHMVKSRSRTQTARVHSDGSNPKSTRSHEQTWVFVTQEIDKDLNQKRSGIRRGQLDPRVAAKARRIRKLKACWKCRIQKVPCSEGEPCETCTRQYSGLAKQLCCRIGLNEYVPTFFPELLYSHLSKRGVEEFVNMNITRFLDTRMDIDVSTGPPFKPIKVQVQVFQPRTKEITGHCQMTVEGDSPVPQLVERYSAPIGILGLDRDDLKAQLKEYVKAVVKTPCYPEAATMGHGTGIPQKILDIARIYSTSKKSSLVHCALKVHVIHHFMGTLLTLSDESVTKVYQQVEPIGAPPGLFLSSRVLNRQIKYVMHLLHREICTEVLEGLEKSLKSRTKDSWGESFCTLLVLCLCIEELQIASDTFVVCDMKREGEGSMYNRGQSLKACLELDEYPFRQCVRLFHDVYHSHQRGVVGGGGRECVFNPLRALAGEGVKVELDKATDEMTTSFFDLISNSHEELLQLSQRSTMLDDEEAEDLNQIRTNNAGRAASKFLLSFFENPDIY